MNERPVHLVIMGVAGTGKTTIGKRVAERFRLIFAEGDDFHSEANKTSMREGRRLVDEDRLPWLHSLRDWMSKQAAGGNSSVVACSALRQVYRDILRAAVGDVYFVHLGLPEMVNVERLTSRQGHYMATGMLGSQLDTLEALADSEDGASVVNIGDPQQVVDNACAMVSERFAGRLQDSETDSS